MLSGGIKKTSGKKQIKDTFAYITGFEILRNKVKLPCFCLRYSKTYLLGTTKFTFMKKVKISKIYLQQSYNFEHMYKLQQCVGKYHGFLIIKQSTNRDDQEDQEWRRI